MNKPLIGKKHDWYISCDEIGLKYYHKDQFPIHMNFDCEIIGLKYGTNLINGSKIALVDPQPGFNFDYLLVVGNLRTMGSDLEQIRRSSKPVIAICDFDFLDDVERYIASGATVIVFKELRQYGQ